MPAGGRQYDIVVFGATGLTGKLTAQHIARHLPTDIRWAIAGRSAKKLAAVLAACTKLNADRLQPALEICSLDDAELGDLARKTTVLISTVGPYAKYGECAFKACAENGTHYLDVTGEVPFVARMIEKYEKAAQTSGAMMIPQIGLESAPADLMTWALVSMIRRELSAFTADVIISVHELRAKPSAGTLTTLFGIADFFTLSEVMKAHSPYGISPVPGPNTGSSASWYSKFVGVRFVKDLGTLTTSLAAKVDAPIIQRSWGLLGGSKFYGPRFYFEGLMRTRNVFTGIGTHLGLALMMLLLALSPVRWLAKKCVPLPSPEAMEENVTNDRVELRGIAVPDTAGGKKTRAFCRASFEGGMYHFTALLLGEAALTILKDDVVAKKLGGGVLTPATLGQPFIDRLRKAGFVFELEMLDD
ncbi:MAG: hypothetical protein M1818_007881 [Claussenomyces sp. TS43310]|nr:MAG: hypothetical protein M1818_007881 [Claussenomyces sp. TS43310]